MMSFRFIPKHLGINTKIFHTKQGINHKSKSSFINSSNYSNNTIQSSLHNNIGISKNNNGNLIKGTFFLSESAFDYQPITPYPASPNEKSSEQLKICILGGGFGGLYTAVKLEQLMWLKGKKPKVILIDQNDKFVFKPLLYEVVTGAIEEWEVAPSFKELLKPYKTHFIQGSVKSIVTAKKENKGISGYINLENGESISYNYLVLAMGAKSDTSRVPGAEKNTIPFSTIEDAQKLNRALDEINKTKTEAKIGIIGAGYSGVELAFSINERLKNLANKKIQLITVSDILEGSPDLQRQAAKEILSKEGIEVVSELIKGYKVQKIIGKNTEYKHHRPCRIYLDKPIIEENEDNQSRLKNLDVDIALWTAGQIPMTKGRNVEKSIPLPRILETGAMETDMTLRVKGYSRIFAIGDVSSVSDLKERMPLTAQVAFQQADYVAWNLWALINDKPLLKFRYQHLGNMMSMGSQNATVSLPLMMPDLINDAVKSFWPLNLTLRTFGLKTDVLKEKNLDVTLQGPLAVLMRRAAYWYRQPTSQHRMKIAQNFFNKNLSRK